MAILELMKSFNETFLKQQFHDEIRNHHITEFKILKMDEVLLEIEHNNHHNLIFLSLMDYDFYQT